MPSSAAGPPSVPGLRIERRVAVGGFGVVYEAVRESDGLRVAIKVARRDRPGAEESLAREVEVLTRVGPPHVPAVLLQGTTPGGAPYLAMEYVEAPTLAERLDGRSAEPSPAQAGALAVAILVALERVHAHGYVHRDLKPENVFAHDDGRVVLVDFGLAAPASDPLDQARVEGAGTAEYMAPEQCEGAPGVDARADLYAVGVMLFELLTGRPPFWGSRADVKESHRSLRPPRASALAEGRAVPAAVDEVVARALSKDPAERWGGAAEMRAALEAALLDDTVTTPAEQGGQREGRGAIGPEGERTTAGLVFFETHLELASLKAAIEALGGHVGDIAGARCVAVFPAGAGDDPARRARRAAEELLRLGACARARVDLAKVGVRRRRDGTRRFIGGIFTSDERFPASGARLQISPAAAEVLGPSEGAAGPPADSSTTELSPSPRGLDAAFEPLVGRDALVAELLESARRAATDGAPTVARIVAEPGLGKSHLARVLAERLAATFAGVLALRAREPALGDVDRALADLLTWALDLPAAPPLDGGEALLAERLGPADHKAFSPAVALALGWIDAERPPISTGEPSPLAAALRAQGAAPGALRATLTVAAGAALRRRAERAPLFVILDDAHHAGDVLIDALELAALAEARAPLWIAILGRPVLERRRPEVGQRAARCERFELAPLDGESAAALCRRLLLPVESAPDAAVQRLVSRAQGSPLLLVELVRGLHREGMVRPSPEGESFYLATDDLDRLPESPLIEWLARRELDALDPALRAHAHLLALLGEQVSLPEIEGLLRRLAARGADDELPLDARIGNRRLLAARVIVKDGAGRVTFRHALVREAVASAVPPELGRRVHAAAAELYATAAPGVDEERRLAQLAYHAGEAGLLAEAARSSLALAERARARHAYTDAERLYSRALLRDAEAPRGGGLPALDRRVARRGRGLMRYRIGRYHDALADLAEAREMAASTGDRAEQVAVLLDEATVLDWAGEFRESAARVEEARALLPVGGSPSLSARLLLGLGRSAFRESRNEEAAALLASAARTAEPLGDEAYETRVIALFQLGFLLSGLGRAEEARWALDESVILAEEHGDRLHLGSALNVRGTLWGNLGDERRLVEDLERSLGIARELGQVSLELMGEFNLAEFLLYLDAPAAAEPHLIRAKALDRRLSGDAGLAAVALLEARLLLQRGDDAAAAGIVAGLRARQRGASAGDGALLVPSDEVLCVMVELLVGGADAAAWEALEARAAGSVAQERLEVLEARGEAAARQGRLDEARASFERALALARRAPNAMERRLARRLAAVSPPRRP